MKAFLTLAISVLASTAITARADEYDNRARAAEARQMAEARAYGREQVAYVQGRVLALLTKMTAPHGGLASRKIDLTYVGYNIIMNSYIRFSTRNGLFCEAIMINVQCGESIGDCPFVELSNPICYDRQNRGWFLQRNGRLKPRG